MLSLENQKRLLEIRKLLIELQEQEYALNTEAGKLYKSDLDEQLTTVQAKIDEAKGG